MDNFDFYKKIKITNKKYLKYFSKLDKIYQDIPETTGCLEHIKSCKGWCCFLQSPQFLYIEFLSIWNHLIKNWEMKDICGVIELAIKNYLAGQTTKGCIFFNRKTKLCNIHKIRGFNCRIYSITPDEDFKPRYDKMKKLYEGVIGAVIKEQCDLVSICDSKKINKDDINKWWNELIDLEKNIGIPRNKINDDVGGSYRTPHDHLLLYIMNDDILLKLQTIRVNGNDKEKVLALDGFINSMRKRLGITK